MPLIDPTCRVRGRGRVRLRVRVGVRLRVRVGVRLRVRVGIRGRLSLIEPACSLSGRLSARAACTRPG